MPYSKVMRPVVAPTLLRAAGTLSAELQSAGAKIRVGLPFWLRPFARHRILAITLGRSIHLDPSILGRSEERIAATLRHELVHVRQAARLGLIRFLSLYVAEYLSLRRRGLGHEEAYRAISFEQEAFAEEAAGAGGAS